jgi:hypothetical protein
MLLGFAVVVIALPVYCILAGASGVYIHNYLMNTGSSSISHDHRFCVYSSLIWPLALVVSIVVGTKWLIEYLYQLPNKIYTDTQNRRKHYK